MPTRNTPWPAGTPCWIDYGASEIDAAKDFYGRLFGWEFEGGDPEYGGDLTATRHRGEGPGVRPPVKPGRAPGRGADLAHPQPPDPAPRLLRGGRHPAGGTTEGEA